MLILCLILLPSVECSAVLFGWNWFCSYSVMLHFQLSDLNDCFLPSNTVNCLLGK